MSVRRSAWSAMAEKKYKSNQSRTSRLNVIFRSKTK